MMFKCPIFTSLKISGS